MDNCGDLLGGMFAISGAKTKEEVAVEEGKMTSSVSKFLDGLEDKMTKMNWT